MQNPTKSTGTATGTATGTTVKSSIRLAIMQAAKSLKVGESVSFPHPESVVRAALPERWKRQEAAFTIRATPDGTVVNRVQWVERLTMRDKIKGMAVGETTRLNDTQLPSVRSMASLISKETGLRYQCKLGPAGEVVVWCMAGDAAPLKTGPQPKFKFNQTGVGGTFTIAKDDHSGVASVRTACSTYGAKNNVIYQARENIDGSITVRCYAIGGLPPKFIIEREHAALQEIIKQNTK